ncbi:MAG: cyclophilin-like fold protein [Desulfobacterales bacterium]
MKNIAIQTKNLSMEAELKDTPTAQMISKSLPLEGSANVWGDEIYFTIPLDLDLEPDAHEEVEIGDMAYWPSGPAFCIFFGPTPVSTDEKPRAYSPVNIFGKIIGDATLFKNISQGEKIRVTQS